MTSVAEGGPGAVQHDRQCPGGGVGIVYVVQIGPDSAADLASTAPSIACPFGGGRLVGDESPLFEAGDKLVGVSNLARLAIRSLNACLIGLARPGGARPRAARRDRSRPAPVAAAPCRVFSVWPSSCGPKVVVIVSSISLVRPTILAIRWYGQRLVMLRLMVGNRIDRMPTRLLARANARAASIRIEAFAAAGSSGYVSRLLASLADEGLASQAELSRRTGIDPSDVVAVLNDLECRHSSPGSVTRTMRGATSSR